MDPRRSVLAAGVLLVFACSDGTGVSSPDESDVDLRTEAFAVAVQHVTQEEAFETVDPRPVRVRGPGPSFSTPRAIWRSTRA